MKNAVCLITGLLIVASFFNRLSAHDDSDKVIIGHYHKLHSKVLKETRILLISVPKGYELSQEKYPVLFVLDGDVSVLSEAFFVLRNLGFGSLPPMVIVAVKNTDRNRDMLPDPKKDGTLKFLQFFSHELIPYIDKNFRTEKFKILYGASVAGVFVLYSLLKDPGTFSAYISSSPTIIWSRDYLLNKLKVVSQNSSEMNKFLYVIYGDKDWTKVRDSLADFLPKLESLKHKGMRIQTEFLPDKGHIPLNSLYHGLCTLFDGYQYPDDKRRNEGLDSLKVYYKEFSKKIGYQVRLPFRALNGVGQSLLFRQKKNKEAVEAFELLKKLYPHEASCDIMLAISYYKDKQIEKAKVFFHKAISNKELEFPPFPEWNEMKKMFK
jgi:predicted alpha/beta superfamily hydrolase